jgi:sigma-54 dependent dga operon transcriptional activator
MPFEQSVHDTLEALTQMIQTRQYRRLILMVDIGSLVHFGSTISKLFQIDVLLMPNITLTSLLEIGLDLSYETSDLPQLAALCRAKIFPVSSVLRSRKTAVKCWLSPASPGWERQRKSKRCWRRASAS